MKKGSVYVFVILFILTSIVVSSLVFLKNSSVVTPSPPPTPITSYVSPKLNKSEAYTIMFVGDSMVGALGENFDELRIDLEKYYPDTIFGLFNYGFGSTNILSAKERLTSETIYDNKNFQAILNREMDILVLGSFGYNPLSEYSLEEGLAKQEDALDEFVLTFATRKPDDLIIFLAEIAPTVEKYGEGQVELSDEKRAEWALERRSYIENHINYAKSHNIPLINIYEKTLDENKVSNLEYINPDDYIHPSSVGVGFMSEEIAKYLWENKIIP